MDDEFTHDQPSDAQRRHDADADKAAARRRIAQQSTWVDLQIRRAMERGDFDELPGAGKPIEGLGEEHDPNWWLKRLIEREKIAVLPASIQLRKEDSELEDLLDRQATEADVRREVEEFNQRVLRARYRPPEGPPLITQLRDVDDEVEQWRTRRAEALAARRRSPEPVAEPPKRRWWRRRPEP